MYLRKSCNRRQDASIDEPLNTDSDGNELLLRGRADQRRPPGWGKRLSAAPSATPCARLWAA